MKQAILHPGVHSDLKLITAYFRRERGQKCADAFYDEFKIQVKAALENPTHYHFSENGFRRINFTKFPFNILFREIEDGIYVLVVRHNKRHPRTGMSRK